MPAATTITEFPTPIPGVRFDANGRRDIFNLDLYNDHRARTRIAEAPADMGSLGDEGLKLLDGACLRLGGYRTSGAERMAISALHDRVLAEMSRRGMRKAFERPAPAQLQAAE